MVTLLSALLPIPMELGIESIRDVGGLNAHHEHPDGRGGRPGEDRAILHLAWYDGDSGGGGAHRRVL